MSNQVTIKINGLDQRDNERDFHQPSDGILAGSELHWLPDDEEQSSVQGMLINGHLADEDIVCMAAEESEPTTRSVIDVKSTVNDLRPRHFSSAQLTKLEEAFARQTSPDRHRLHVLAMESNLTFSDAQAWFKLRRLKWIQEIGKRTSDSIILPSVDC